MRELLARTDSAELTEWMAFYKLEPFGYDIDNHRAGTIASTLVNLKLKKDAQPMTPGDFFPNSYGEEAQQEPSPAQQEFFMQGMATLFKGQIIRAKEDG